ncbi:glycosyltransferase family 2 protein [Acetobacteraceae bacterium H6797]|nr:glycosyltransferase family 2 protein [Acetobacteraceae bacterium H6797]
MALRLSVIVPCYNEAGNVAEMVRRLDAALAGVSWEVIFVDDNSPDGTAGIAKAIAGEDARVRCIRRVGRRGLASACIEGMLASAATHVAVIDGDLQHDETILPEMLARLESGEAEIAIGSRHVEGGDSSEGLSPIRQRISNLGGDLARAFIPSRVNDPMSGFFMLPRATLDALAPKLKGRGFKILFDILLAAGRPMKVAEVPYVFRQRFAGESKLDAGVLLDFLGQLIDRALFGLVPLRFLGFCAVGMVGLAVHLAVLWLVGEVPGARFGTAQWAATFVAMTVNFWLNNKLTYRDTRLKGPRLWRGLLLFYVVCGIGAAANNGIAVLMVRQGIAGWGLAGGAGALMTVVWNYAVSSTLVWRASR